MLLLQWQTFLYDINFSFYKFFVVMDASDLFQVSGAVVFNRVGRRSEFAVWQRLFVSFINK